LIRWLLEMLLNTENHQLKWKVIHTALGLEFPSEEAESQVDTMINWGRYGELLTYDDRSELIELESV